VGDTIVLTVWGRKSSSNVQAVLWCLAELGVEHERIDAGFTYGVVDTPEYRAMNPNGKVPTIRDGDAPPLFESGAILRYLAARHAPERFWPSDPLARAGIDQWAEWAKVNVTQLFTVPVFWQVVRVPAARRERAAIARSVETLEGVLAIADARLAERAFIAGEVLTLADIQLGHVLYRYYDVDIERGALPHLRRYYERLAERAAYRDNVMVSYAELADSM